MTRLNESTVTNVLTEYMDKFVPAMLRWRYHLILVKGGPDYPHLAEQSHFAHIINGIFGMAELVKFVVKNQVLIPDLNEETLRKALALFTIHEVHKAWDYEKLGTSEFSIPLERLGEEYSRLGLSSFADVDDYLMRSANVHKRSPQHGDVLLSEEEVGSFLWLLVRIADTFASVQTPEEACSSLTVYLKRLGPAFAPKHPPGRYALYYHAIRDVRGVLTNTLHEAVSRKLESGLGLYPLLFFATGTLYLGSSILEPLRREEFIQGVISETLNSLREYGDSSDAIREGQRASYFDYETFVYSFAEVATLLELVRDDTIVAKVKAQDIIGEGDKGDFSGLLKKKGLSGEWTTKSVYERFALNPNEENVFLEHWGRARRYLLYVDKMLRQLNPSESALEWFLRHFTIPEQVVISLREVGELWAKGGPGKYVVPIAYHFLRGQQFAARSVESMTANQVIDKLHSHVVQAMEELDTRSGQAAAVEALGFRQDLTVYLSENLRLSFAPETSLKDDSLASYSQPKKKSPETPFCAICGRSGEYVQAGRTGILDDFLQVFSNRMLPVRTVQGNRSWCPVCQLEFILRKLTGMGLPSGAHYKKSSRIFLYVLPTFSFTRGHLQLYSELLNKLLRVSNMPVRDFGKDRGLPYYWLNHQELDAYWMESLEEVLTRQAEKIAGWGGRSFIGERISLGNAKGQPHYFLITWEKIARETESDDAKLATYGEAWSKALFCAAIISAYTSCKVYVTERPFLPITDPKDLKATIILDGPPPPLRGMLAGQHDSVTLYGREKGQKSGLEQVLDLSAALWTVTTAIHAPDRNPKDKYVAERLSEVNINPLAGARFYKEYSRLNDGKSPSNPIDIACEVLLKAQGGELMNLVEEISTQALAIRLPLRSSGRGKIHNYELAFREGVAAMRKAFPLVPELRQAVLTGQKPSADAIAELKGLASGTLLKGMERRAITKRSEGVINPWHGNLNRLTRLFIDTLIDEVYLERANGSFARFLSLENSLADGVYYYTDRNLAQLWDQYKQQKAERKIDSADKP